LSLTLKPFFIFFVLLGIMQPAAVADVCGDSGVMLQMLGSGGPELGDQRASSSYLIWKDGSARFLVDAGGGSMLRFEQSSANLNDLEAVLLSHLHVDHSADLPVFVKSSFFTHRRRDLPIYGPTGNQLMPATTKFVNALFGKPDGAYRYLSSYIEGTDEYRIVPHDVSAEGVRENRVIDNNNRRITAIPVHHGPIPALAWRIDIDGKSIVFSGDMNGSKHTLEKLAIGADVLVAHHAIPESAGEVARNLHMKPSTIGRIAAQAKVGKVILSHRMTRTVGQERQSLDYISRYYKGVVILAEDLQCFNMH